MTATAGRSGVDRRSILAFVVLVALVGTNTVAIRYSNRELDPLWNAAIRFAAAAVVFVLLAAGRGARWPGARSAVGAAVYGILGFVLFFAFLYAGLERATVGLAQTILALGPLLTLAMAVAVGLERPRLRVIGGGLIALAGLATAFAGELGVDVPPISLLAVLAAATAFAAAGIVAKRLPPSDPVVQNAIGTTVAAVLLLVLSVAAGERRELPHQAGTWLAVVYLAIPGTVAIFLLFLHLIRRWRASTVAYQFVLAPIVSIGLAAVLLDEPVTPLVIAGAALVVGGVWLGALSGGADDGG